MVTRAMTAHLASHELHQLRAFLVVAKHLSFSRAAEVLGITPSSLSQTVRNFEETVGSQFCTGLRAACP
ncbi:LysR family transcriptional regulator [Rhizobium sp. ZW T2_16]|uniref:LysR family transcriptional regulator n=2 Tax=Rhizobium/Agrobacterium group TaxID=227290 RepID=UPI00385412C5